MAGGTPIKDCVFTVPSYFTLNQRRMLLQAINIAGLNILNMVHENTAAGVIYGITN
jgi:molecular chaperone DnaK